jgi:hypothetical protein
MAEDKIEAIKEWQAPRSLRGVQSFLGFANFYRRFIKDFSRICRPLTESTTGDKKDWCWRPEMQNSFEELKNWFTTAPILTYFDLTQTCIVETDASHFALRAILSQKDNEGRLHPIAIHSRKFQPAEINYEVHDKVLLAMIDSFKVWRRYLDGALCTAIVYSDHQNLEYFTTTKVLNRRQARWAQELAAYDFKIVYHPGSQNGKPVALSWRSEYHPEKAGSEDQPISTILSPNNFLQNNKEETELISASKLSKRWIKWSTEFVEKLTSEGEKDEEYKKEFNHLLENEEQEQNILHQEEGILYRKLKLWVSSGLRLEVCESEHDSKVAGHMG